jgi:Protein of unknown function (DUF3363)
VLDVAYKSGFKTRRKSSFKHLSNLGLATVLQTGVWEIDPDVERKLKGLGKRNDIIATMHEAKPSMFLLPNRSRRSTSAILLQIHLVTTW